MYQKFPESKLFFIREKWLKELLYQKFSLGPWLSFLLQLVHYRIHIGTDFSINTMNIAYLYRHGIWGKQHCSNQLCGNRGGRAQGHGGPPLQVLGRYTYVYLYLDIYINDRITSKLVMFKVLSLFSSQWKKYEDDFRSAKWVFLSTLQTRNKIHIFSGQLAIMFVL